MNRKSFKDHIL